MQVICCSGAVFSKVCGKGQISVCKYNITISVRENLISKSYVTNQLELSSFQGFIKIREVFFSNFLFCRC